MAGSLRGRLVRQIAHLATLGWFRSVERSGLERIDRHRPLLVIANHDGGFVDPALLSAVLPRFPRFLAMATLWRTPARPFLWLGGAIPVHRAVDGGTQGNIGTFSECHRVLGGRGVVAVFPEGQANDEPHLLPVHTGAARIALGARARGANGLSVVPVGLMYEDKTKARARAYVRVGEPLEMDAWVAARGSEPDGASADETDHAAVTALTEELRARLATVALDFRDAAELAALNEAAEIALRPIDADLRWNPPMASREDLASALGAAPRDAVATVRHVVERYTDALEANAVTDEAVATDPRNHRRRHLTGLALTAVMIGPAIAGLVVNLVPALLTHAAGRRNSAPVTRATVKFLVALVVFPATWVIWRYTAVADERSPWLAILVLGPGCGLALSWVADRIRRGRRARLDLRELAGVGTSLEGLRARRDEVVVAVAAAVASGSPRTPARTPGSLGNRP
ncbi:MAG TPA: 1-acyl-sn-glycerol-3-phosphate acyltransferase [Actinomycetota bacterium]